MLENRNLIVDTMSEVYDLLKPWITHEFWDFQTHEVIANSVYIIGRKQFTENIQRIRELALDPGLTVVFDNAAEGSTTLEAQMSVLGIQQLCLEGRILVLAGAPISSEYPHITYEHFLCEIVNYEENHAAMARRDQIFTWQRKPYAFLFLNGRARPHRKYLWERLRQQRLLDRSLWTMLDSRPSPSSDFELNEGWHNVMLQNSELRTLPYRYEFPQWRGSSFSVGPGGAGFIKNQLFNNLWGEIYLQAEPYIDTYFSLVTETVYETDHSFRTEKIAKPIMQGHPWICAANRGFYRDMRNLGFRTFGELIDESFDMIDNHQDRMDRIVAVVQDLVRQDLNQFIMAARETCIYNQQHLLELVPRLRSQFPQQFLAWINERPRLP